MVTHQTDRVGRPPARLALSPFWSSRVGSCYRLAVFESQWPINIIYHHVGRMGYLSFTLPPPPGTWPVCGRRGSENAQFARNDIAPIRSEPEPPPDDPFELEFGYSRLQVAPLLRS